MKTAGINLVDTTCPRVTKVQRIAKRIGFFEPIGYNSKRRFDEKNMTKIIIVEDDPMISEIYQKKFSEAGFEVLTATSGEQVLNMAKRDQADVILLDLIMPKMDGFEVVRNLRSGDYNQDLKIIIFSNLNEQEKIDKAIALGANGFVAKSNYSPSELVKEVERLMNQYSEQRKNELRAMEGEKETEQNKEKKKKILMIEDEPVFLEMFGGKLEQEGYAVTLADNGAWGLKEALRKDFDLFIVDMVMPAMSGEDMVAKLKLEEKTKDKPIVILSASVDDQDRKKVEAMGITEFIVKTQVTPSELVKKISAII